MSYKWIHHLMFAAGMAIGPIMAFAVEAMPTVKPTPPAHVEFNRDIRPILSENCFACHGPDKSKRKGKFRLDERESAIAKKAIIPGKPDDSPLVQRIFTADADDHMPPAEAHKTLSAAQKNLLRQWIAQGAVYQPFWAYVAPTRPPLPQVKNGTWTRNPIDAFILAALEAKQIAPSPQADRRTLLRRLSLDLTGLPPTPQEMQAFLDDPSPDAYEKQVDRLLASPHYGERMAVPWLDAARFADTVGYHGDQNQNVFPYRDYVINAFNANKPFDQFTTEQLAGDLLPHPTTEQLVATGFNRLNMVTREGGAQDKEYLNKYMVDRVRTIGSVFLGSTFACCQCHDHKFDPISARDFYSMGAFFADIKQWGIYTDYPYTPNPDLKGWTNDHPFPPEIVVDSPYLQKRAARLGHEIDAVVARAEAGGAAAPAVHARANAWRESTTGFLHDHPDGWLVADPVISPGKDGVSKGIERIGEEAILFTGRPGETEQVEFSLKPGTVGAVRLELLPQSRHHDSILRGGSSTTVRFVASVKGADGGMRGLSFVEADADHKEDRYANGYAIIGIQDAWRTDAKHVHEAQTGVYLLQSPIKIAEGDRLVLKFSRNAIGSARVSVTPIMPRDPIDPNFYTAVRGALNTGTAASTTDAALIHRTFLLSTAWDPAAVAEVRKIHQDVLLCRCGKSATLITVAWKPAITRILPRGNWQDESGPIVQPALPHFLPHLDTDPGRRLTRLDLARWILSPQNPLTARVIVNRLWKEFYGAGICSTVDDFGSQGDVPSHPQLLDWLAVEFRASGWDVKHMVRLMVTSATYRQESDLRPSIMQIDPSNRLLASQNPRRLEAEFVRDNALAAAGLLNLDDIGGPSIFPYQPPGYYANIQFPSRSYIPSPDTQQWRRGLYIHWQRTFLHPMLANFDAPSREDSACTRNVSNTPQQALTLLDDPEFVEAARVLAEKVIGSPDDAARLDAIFQRVLCRPPRAPERQSLLTFLEAQRDYFKANPQDAKKLNHTGMASVPASADSVQLAAWANVCRVVLNLHESITRY